MSYKVAIVTVVLKHVLQGGHCDCRVKTCYTYISEVSTWDYTHPYYNHKKKSERSAKMMTIIALKMCYQSFW